MILIKKIFLNFLLFIVSIFLVLVFIEFLLSVILTKQDYSLERYMLFKSSNGKNVFKNIEGGFVYYPNITVNSSAFFYINEEWIKEYDYNIPTNNFGLVQTNNINTDKDSILILGDSYTEGVGSYPWFENFNEEFFDTEFQFINGGILGTGFEFWLNLYNHLIEKKVKISKIIILFTSDDYRRGAWYMHKNTIECINNYKNCEGNENFYGKPPENFTKSFLNRLKDYRNNNKGNIEDNLIINYLKINFPEIRSFNRNLRRRLEINDSPKILKSNEVIKFFIDKFNDKVLFVHIPTKFEIIFNNKDFFGLKTIEYIKKNNGKIIDGFKECNFNEDDFYKYDGHPNEKGYSKLSDCIKKVTKNFLNL